MRRGRMGLYTGMPALSGTFNARRTLHTCSQRSTGSPIAYKYESPHAVVHLSGSDAVLRGPHHIDRTIRGRNRPHQSRTHNRNLIPEPNPASPISFALGRWYTDLLSERGLQNCHSILILVN